MAEIVNDNKLTLILTKHGLSRIAEALQDSSVTIEISSIRLGSGKNNEYYVPSENQEKLEGDLDIKLPVVEKALLEDNLTVCFRTIISENVGNIDIREVGLYENYYGEEKLFAISTQQPFVKPDLDFNYLISIDYYIFLKASNVAQIYDQIVLSTENHMATETDLQELMNAMLFAHGNLVNQIGNNSRIVGYNRATQLYELIIENKQNYGYITTYKNYADILEAVGTDKILAYWVFDRSRHESLTNSILDLSLNKTNLSTGKPVSTYPKEYLGFMSTLGFPANDYFYLDSSIPFNLLNNEGTEDSPFTMIFAIKPYTNNSKKTLLAKSNYGTSSHIFEVSILENNSLEVKLFSSSTDYLTFSTAPNTIEEGITSIIISYENILKKMKACINGTVHEMGKEETGTYTHLNATPSTLYAFSCKPEHIIFTNSSTAPTSIYNEDGTPYTGSDWTIENNTLKYNGSEAFYDEESSIELDVLYAWNYNDGVYDHTAYTKETTINSSTILYDENYQEIEQSEAGFRIVMSDLNYLIQYNRHNTLYDQDKNIPRLFAWTYDINTAYTKTKVINASTPLYNSAGVEIEQSDERFKVNFVGGKYVIQYNGNNTFYNSPLNIPTNFRYAWKFIEDEQTIWANTPSAPSLLYNENGSPYTGSNWYISLSKVYYKGIETYYNPSSNISLSILNLTPYIIDVNGSIKDPIDSKVGLIAVLKEALPESEARAFSLLLEGTMGRNPYVNRR